MFLAVTVFTTIAISIISLIVGGVIGIFFYRNNKRSVGPYADKVDNVYKKIKK